MSNQEELVTALEQFQDSLLAVYLDRKTKNWMEIGGDIVEIRKIIRLVKKYESEDR